MSSLRYPVGALGDRSTVIPLLSDLSETARLKQVKAAHAFVSGHVQGVAFRQSTRREARHRHLDGWVRNTTDGRVEVFLQGDEQAVNAMIDWLWTGPPYASVTGLESDTVDPDTNLQDFLITN